jgi:hypothetical protein
MKSIIEKKILEVQEQMKSMETQPLYYLKPAWSALNAQLLILREVISEMNVIRAVELQKIANRELDVLGEISNSILTELERLTDSFDEVERNSFIRLMKVD